MPLVQTQPLGDLNRGLETPRDDRLDGRPQQLVVGYDGPGDDRPQRPTQPREDQAQGQLPDGGGGWLGSWLRDLLNGHAGMSINGELQLELGQPQQSRPF